MKVAHILPTKYLWLGIHSSYHLVLAHKLIQDNEYRLWYQQRATHGDFIIVDNGEVEFAYSGELSARLQFKDIVAAANSVAADEICMPDIFYDGEATIAAQTDEVLALVEPRRRMFIPQGDNIKDWMHCCSTLLGRFQCRSVGIPKHMERFGRRKILREIEEIGWQRTHDVHLLGVWDNPNEVLHCALEFSWVRGIDTGVAVAYAQHDLRVQDYAGHHIGMNWDSDGSKLNDRLAEFNILKLGDWSHARNLTGPRERSRDGLVRGPSDELVSTPPAAA